MNQLQNASPLFNFTVIMIGGGRAFYILQLSQAVGGKLTQSRLVVYLKKLLVDQYRRQRAQHYKSPPIGAGGLSSARNLGSTPSDYRSPNRKQASTRLPFKWPTACQKLSRV
uniref:Uncharacterized protein n=1 Tax=Chrysotila carterae TaxID=13221 RepID=A0A7S4C1H6_CHRCT